MWVWTNQMVQFLLSFFYWSCLISLSWRRKGRTKRLRILAMKIPDFTAVRDKLSNKKKSCASCAIFSNRKQKSRVSRLIFSNRKKSCASRAIFGLYVHSDKCTWQTLYWNCRDHNTKHTRSNSQAGVHGWDPLTDKVPLSPVGVSSRRKVAQDVASVRIELLLSFCLICFNSFTLSSIEVINR